MTAQDRESILCPGCGQPRYAFVARKSGVWKIRVHRDRSGDVCRGARVDVGDAVARVRARRYGKRAVHHEPGVKTQRCAAVAAAIREQRERAELSLAEVAARLDQREVSTLSRIESGQQDIGLQLMWSIALALGVTPSSLLRRAEEILAERNGVC